MGDQGKGKYQGQDVTIVRKAKTSDKGWDQSPTVGEQVVVTLPDGTEKTVPKNQITPAS